MAHDSGVELWVFLLVYNCGNIKKYCISTVQKLAATRGINPLNGVFNLKKGYGCLF